MLLLLKNATCWKTISSHDTEEEHFIESDTTRTSKQVKPSWEYFGFRDLQEEETYDVSLYLELQFVNENTAAMLESRSGEDSVVSHFCDCVEEQVS